MNQNRLKGSRHDGKTCCCVDCLIARQDKKETKVKKMKKPSKKELLSVLKHLIDTICLGSEAKDLIKPLGREIVLSLAAAQEVVNRTK